MSKIIKKIKNFLNLDLKIKMINKEIELLKLQNGKILSNQNKILKIKNIKDSEFKVFSQWGEDGIINYLVNNLNIKNNFFVEFGVENYLEANTRFLLKNFNWSGLIIDSNQKIIDYIKTKCPQYIDRIRINDTLAKQIGI